jgi:hypothetical protein
MMIEPYKKRMVNVFGKRVISDNSRAIRVDKKTSLTYLLAFVVACATIAVSKPTEAASAPAQPPVNTLEEAREAGALHSAYKNQRSHSIVSGTPEPDLATFQAEIGPILEATCFKCHGEEKQKGDFRVDSLDPDFLHGEDVDWWLDVFDVLTLGEMPPEDEEEMAGEDRGKVIDWLSSEIQLASQIRRSEGEHSSFRRMTRYEYNYALQDLLGLDFDLAGDLPPETHSEDGFENSSEMLQMSVMQLEYYRELGRSALEKATVRGEQPQTLYYGIKMEDAVAQIDALSEKERKLGRSRGASNPYFKKWDTDEEIRARYRFNRAKYSYRPSVTLPEVPQRFEYALILPADSQHIFDLGDTLPDTGMLRVRALASRVSTDEKSLPAIRLEFGFEPSSSYESAQRVYRRDVTIQAPPGQPQFYEWNIPLSEFRRNPYRGQADLGAFPNPSEYLLFNSVIQNTGDDPVSDIHIDYLEVTTPFYEQWPPESHTRIFIDSENQENEEIYAREVLASFLPRAWRKPVTDAEIRQHMAMFDAVRPMSDDFQEAMIEVLATALASPKFLYIVQEDPQKKGVEDLTDYELATRLSMFLWSSLPDEELLKLASKKKLKNRRVLQRQTRRMLADPRSERFSKQFVQQWLGMQLLEFLDVEEELYPQFDTNLREAMQKEPVAFFQEVLRENRSVMDFLHADYALVNERLARHYGIPDVYGSDFRKVGLDSIDHRGGILTQAGLLAMNSDGKDSHPLKRGIWILERLLNDPPPPPPPAVPEIDLTDPEIAKMTLKERIENHRNDPACYSCHAKIDPWGIAFENFDAVGSWRDQINGVPVDANSALFNNQKLNGIDGVKRFLLTNRQDQFSGAMVHKLTTYALGRPLSFGDRASIDEITFNLRNKGDRLGDLISFIVTSDRFLTK